jgi:hypothetical protein
MAFALPEDLITRKTHQFCPQCSAVQVQYNEEHYPEINKRIWPVKVELFDKGHVDSDGRYICNYHGNKEFNPDHDCEENECD